MIERILTHLISTHLRFGDLFMVYHIVYYGNAPRALEMNMESTVWGAVFYIGS